MKIKVCGIIDQENLNEITSLEIDMIGLNFYKPSKRYLGEEMVNFGNHVPKNIARVGVFVNEELDKIIQQGRAYHLDYAQLHGSESSEYCKQVQMYMKVIKVFGIQEGDDIDQKVKEFSNCQYFLFDTKSPDHGGTGIKFDWKTLNTYTGDTPFFLSGGIGPEDVLSLREIDHPQMVGVDINSKFEIEPGIKNTEKVSYFIKNLREK